MRPRIGITFSDEIRVEPYAEAVSASGGEPILIRPDSPVQATELDGLILAGGVDVNPLLYGEEAAPETEAPNDRRDRKESELLEQAIARDLPVLAICRGMQLLNVAQGGTLLQHRTGHEVRERDRSEPAHTVEVASGSRLGQLTQAATLAVNSRHHQVVGKVGGSLQVSAQASDGTVEAIESRGHNFLLGVQWHPEDMAADHPLQKRIFDALVSAASVAN